LRDAIGELTAEARTAYLTLEAGGLRPSDVAPLIARARVAIAAVGAATHQIRGRLDAVTAGVGRIDRRIDAPRPALEAKLCRAVAAFDDAVAKVERVTKQVQELAAMVARGEGSIGRL